MLVFILSKTCISLSQMLNLYKIDRRRNIEISKTNDNNNNFVIDNCL